MELRQLHYFVKVAKKEHVTQAAEELHVAQSAVSRQIHQLEEELGVKLFLQKGRNLQLTPAGQLFLKRAEVILDDLEKAVVEIHEFMDPERGEIRLGFPHSLGMSLVPQVVAAFRKQHPKVQFRFKQGMFPSLLRDMMQGDIDLAFISPFPDDHQSVCGEVLLTEQLLAILPPSHPLAGSEEIDLAQLKDETFVMFSEGYSLRPIVLEACLEAGFTPKVGFEGEETDTIRGLVAAGMGVSLLPDMALSQTGPLQPAKVKLKSPAVTRTIGLIRRSNEKLPKVANVFRTFLIEYFQKEIQDKKLEK
ncbi:LysR family transcriptional activator of glutamate synthase operon [Paenibacillus cellulosilyticus]|uniref:LysR family transcriptional activator of glutamate synthase operon n=1 Tax=Paenibacillus cellulosilyticus TaxID=375489 RepID=A0A2V2YR84_9BACL|nr:LysR family transcriptional regulator [Paenibacillus cellulosilyticus]PWV99654.1 LysR family transcriptional activator of glutamate synthase operon [Paenibacillus cellulosilyticus]QKS44908.1 LysR family transcriptional regulator [Paenibacillus cellulosilyticus]